MFLNVSISIFSEQNVYSDGSNLALIDKGRIPPPNRMNFSHFLKIILQFVTMNMVAFMQGGIGQI